MAVIFIPGITPLTIAGTPTTSGTAGSPITPFTVVGNGGKAPRSFSLVGEWPPGASVGVSSGVVTPGTAPDAATYAGLSVRVTDDLGSVADLAGFDLTVSAGGSYTCGAVAFDGATKAVNAALVASDSGLLSLSFWQWQAADGTGTGIFAVDAAGDDQIVMNALTTVDDPTPPIATTGIFANPAGSAGVNILGAVPSFGSWQNIKISIDLTVNPNVGQVYVGDTDADAGNAPRAATGVMLFNGKSFNVGDDGFNDFFTGYLAELWIAPNQYIDWSIQANRRKFIDGSGKPVSLGADGSTPTGTAPAILLHIDAAGTPADFADNLGTGGAFSLNAGTTQTGALVNTSADVVMADVTGITVGAFITATGVPAGTTVLSINTLTVTMSAAATASNPTASMQFGGVLRLAPSSPSD